jgi:hypothetical protein
MDESTHQSEAEAEPEMETKQQPVRNSNVKSQAHGHVQKTKQQRPQRIPPKSQPAPLQQQPEQQQNLQFAPSEAERRTGHIGGPYGIIRQSRIKDRPVKAEEKDSAVKIKIELDLEVEVDLYARVKGDVTIGLM